METIKRTLAITGANKGVGFGIVESILKQRLNYHIILCSRSKDNGEVAVNDLKNRYKEKSSDLSLATLDITNKDSIVDFIQHIKKNFNGKIDCLINNAGVAYKPSSEFNTKVFDYTFETNYYATVNFTETLLSERIISDNGKIIIIGSTSGLLHRLKNQDIANIFRSDEVTVEKMNDIAKKFRHAIENDLIEKDGWYPSVYGMSKICINTYAKVLANRKERKEDGIQVYSCCPGSVLTNMNGKGSLTLEEGSRTPIYLINLPYKIDENYQGKFFYMEKVRSLDN